MTSTDLVTTLDIKSTKVKTFFFNKRIGDIKTTVKAAKQFCKDNKMKFLGCETKQPYEFHSWQHNEMIVFKAECSSRTRLYWYEYGKL